MHEQGGPQAAAEWLDAVDFDMGQLFWEIRDAVAVGSAEAGWADGAPRSPPTRSCLSSEGCDRCAGKLRYRRGSLAKFYGTFSSRPDAIVNHLS